MPVKLVFTLCVEKERYDDVISNLKRAEIDVKDDRDRKGDIVCITTIPNQNAEGAANVCSYMCNIDGVDKVRIFVKSEPESTTETRSEQRSVWYQAIPLIPMITSAAITFFIVFSVVDQLKAGLTWWDYLKLAGIPAAVAFLSQFGHEYYDWFRKNKK